MELRVAGYQMAVTRDISANAAKIVEAIDWAAAQGAHLLLTPEGSLSGYTHAFDVDQVARALEQVTRHAHERAVGLALGTCFVEPDGCCYNQIRFYRPDGSYLGFHSKTLCCGTLEPQPRGEIEHFSVSPLRVFTWAPGVTIGGLICNDLWANPGCTPMPDPHLTQRLADMGARVLLHAVNGGRDGSQGSRLGWQYHEANLQMRARAGGLWIVTVDSAQPVELPCSAPSGVIDPQGQWVCRTEPQGERLFVRSIGLD
jgi:predicted amidohydrolase